MNDLLVICCTRGRPDKAKEMFDSLKETSSCDVVFCIDSDDPAISKYNEWMGENRIIGNGQTTTQLINLAFQSNPEYEFYSVTNDDVVYETPGWDVALKNKGKISYGNDKCQGANMPTISVIDGDICRAVGWLQMIKLIHLYGDCVWKVIGERLKILYYDKNVIINHKHFLYNHRIEKDSTYAKTNSHDMYVTDGHAFEIWVRDEMINDCNKIKEILCHR